MYTLYTIPGTCSTGIHALLNSLNIPFELVKRDDVDNYQQLVPTNQVPALKDGNRLLTEGAAISHYLLEKHQVDLEKLGGNTDFDQWLMFCYATLHPSYSKMFAAMQGMPDGQAKQQFYQAMADKTASLWRIIDQRLEGKTFACGDTPCVVDYLLAVYASWGNVFPDHPIKLGDNVISLVKRVAELPEFIAAYQREGANHAIPANGF